jgi:hypothetical protein
MRLHATGARARFAAARRGRSRSTACAAPGAAGNGATHPGSRPAGTAAVARALPAASDADGGDERHASDAVTVRE